MLDALGSEYVKLARIKGLRATVIWKHALSNSLIPVVTFMGTFFATMITGRGRGRDGVRLARHRPARLRVDPVARLSGIQTVVLVITALFILANLIVDLLYLAIDPRMRARG